MGRLDGKVAIITGAASGMGRASAVAMAWDGAKVVVADINVEGGPQTVSLVKNAGGEAMFVPVDATKVSDLQKMVKAAAETYGKLDVLCNNAGCPGPNSVESATEEQWDFPHNLLVKSGSFATQAAMPE
jgi:NAD(P)-dependent dehydrogenase (short-subunit alcohol dehydrogenase family)